MAQKIRNRERTGETERRVRQPPAAETIMGPRARVRIVEMLSAVNEEDLRFDRNGVYEKMVESLGDEECTAEYVRKAVECLSALKRNDALPNERAVGLLISAMINSGPDNDYVLDMRELVEIDMLGYRCCKNMRVCGDVGNYLGQKQESGKISVFGHAKNHTGAGKTGGELFVYSTGDYTGIDMKGGSIRVRDGAGENVGWMMEGGEIDVGLFAESVAMCMLGKSARVTVDGQAYLA